MIDILVKDINTALENKAYLSALSLALTLPDVCGKAEYPSDSVTQRYKKWFDYHIGKYETYEGNTCPYLSGEIVFSLRNSLLHQATPNIDKTKIKDTENIIDRFILVIEPVNQFQIYFDSATSNFFGENIYRVSIQRLCLLLTTSAELYYKKNKDKFNFIKYEIEYEN